MDREKIKNKIIIYFRQWLSPTQSQNIQMGDTYCIFDDIQKSSSPKVKNVSANFKLIMLFFVIIISFSLESCKNGNGNKLTINDVALAEIKDTTSPIIAVVSDKNAAEAIGIITEKDPEGHPIKITGIVYSSKSGIKNIVEIDNEGLPISITDSSGNKIVYENYTNATVNLSLYDSNGKLVKGPIKAAMDPDKIANIKEQFAPISFNDITPNISTFNNATAKCSIIPDSLKKALHYGSLTLKVAICLSELV